jgi:hypothetical protein
LAEGLKFMRTNILIAILAILLILPAGCLNGGSTTQPAMPSLAQQVQTLADVTTFAEQGVTAAIQLKIVTPAYYYAHLDPIFTEINQTILPNAQKAAAANDGVSFQTYASQILQDLATAKSLTPTGATTP